MTQNNGGPAFPLSTIDGYATDGMTLRDWFAGQALAGMLSHSESVDAPISHITEMAYGFADAMLKARETK